MVKNLPPGHVEAPNPLAASIDGPVAVDTMGGGEECPIGPVASSPGIYEAMQHDAPMG
jgi:hypothetical protein